jgi:hypothetical protein
MAMTDEAVGWAEGTRGKTPGNRNPLIRFCFLNIAVDSIPGRTQVLRQVAQQPRAR